MQKGIILYIIAVMFMFGAVVVYDVEPSYNDNYYVIQASQSFIATADSIGEVAFFCGKKIIPGNYMFRLADSMGSYITDWKNSDSAGLFEHEFVYATFDPKVFVLCFCVNRTN